MNTKSKSPLKVALAGCGWFAQVAHLPALRQLELTGAIEIVALFSRRQDSILRAQQVIGRAVQGYTDYSALLANEDINAVDLVLPTPLMYPALRAAFQANKHVLSEKPCAASLAQCSELLQAYAGSQGRVAWGVAENWRFKPTVLRLVELVRGGQLGQLLAVDFNYSSLGWQNDKGWRSSAAFRGGYLLDSGVHFVAMLRLLADGALQVNAKTQWRPPGYVADHVESEVLYAHGVRGRFNVSFKEPLANDDPFQLRIEAENGRVLADFLNSKLEIHRGGEVEVIQVPNDPWVQGGVYPMLKHCMESFSMNQAPRCSPVEAMKDVAIIEAMMQSSRLGSPVNPASLYNQLNGSGPSASTFGGFQNFRPRHFVECSTTEEVKTALREATSFGLPVRPFGLGNTWSPYAKSLGVSIQLDGHKHVRQIDRDQKTVWVGAGIRLGDLTQALAAQGLCLPSLPFLAEATLAGAISTAMHGTSPHWGTVSDSVLSVRLITASGDELVIDRGSAGELLQAAKVAIGMLGVIVEVELQLVEMPWARNIRVDVTLDEFAKIKSALFERFGHVWVHWILGQDKMVAQCLELSPLQKEGFTPYVAGDKGCWIPAYQAPPVQLKSEGLMLSMQYALPATTLEDVIQQVNASEFGAHNLGKEIEIKFLKQDPGTFLGPNANWDAACLNTWWPVERQRAETVFRPFEEMMLERKARPHWGKQHTVPSQAYLKQCYPAWDRFEKIRAKLDPQGVFSIFSGVVG